MVKGPLPRCCLCQSREVVVILYHGVVRDHWGLHYRCLYHLHPSEEVVGYPAEGTQDAVREYVVNRLVE